MPELPEVETVARDLRGLIVGSRIVGARCDWPSTLRTHDAPTFAAEIAGRTVEGVGRRAKQVLVELSGDRVLTIHLKMTGQLFVVPAGSPTDAHVHAVIDLDDGRELRFRDIRKFGRLGLYVRDPVTGEALSADDGGAVFRDHGPEPLAPEFTLGAFRRILRSRRSRLKPLLLDQSFVAGIGNIYADEALWAARLHPLRSATSLRPRDELRLYRAIRSILAEAVARRGSSIDDYTAPDGDGSMQERLQVYQRTGEPCPRCGRPIRRIVVGARATHFCSWCQRLSAADRRAAAAILRAAAPGGGSAASEARRGPRWVELPGGALGLTAGERRTAERPAAARPAAARPAAARPAAPAAIGSAERAARNERIHRAAATRRARARIGAGAAADAPDVALPEPVAEPATTA